MVGNFAYKKEKTDIQIKKGLSFSLLTFSFREGCKFLISRFSFILQWVSDRSLAKISKLFNFVL